MSTGPFVTYAPPGVYSRTLSEANVSNLTSGLRIPFVIGVGQQELSESNVEIVRGSSAVLDQQTINEDVSVSWVVDATNPNNLKLGAQNGQLVQFKVRNGPIVDGQGIGRPTNDVRTVSVTVNGLPVAIGAVQGQKSLVTLQVPTQPGDVVRVTYYFHRGDSRFTDDVTAQVTAEQAILMTPGVGPFVITAGLNDLFKFKVNGAEKQVTLVAGSLSASSLKTQLDALAVANFSTAVFVDAQGKSHVQLVSTQSVEVLDGTANGPLGFSNFVSTTRNATFTVFNRPIVDGSGSGITSTDTSKVTVMVNGAQVIPSAVDGANGTVTLPFAPAMGSTVTVQYWANTWQDTFDYLPKTLVTNVSKCGIAPNRADYIQGQDFVILNPSSDVSVIHWGTSWQVAPASTSAGAAAFGPSQVTGQLVDEKIYLAECSRVVNTTVIPAVVSTTEFLLTEVPTTGNGRDTTLGTATYSSVTNGRQDVVTNRPDLVVVRVGRNLRDALNRPAAKVLKVDGASRKVTLKDPVPADWKAYATHYYNRIVDDTYLMTSKVAGAVGLGQYELFSTTQNANLLHVKFGTKSSLPQIVQWPRGAEQVPDAMHVGGAPVAETVTVTFAQAAATNAVYTIKGAGPYSFYPSTSATWASKVNGSTVSTNLATAVPAVVVGAHVKPIQSGGDAGKITITTGVNDVLNVLLDGVLVTTTLTAGNRTPAQIIGEINTAAGATVASVLQIGSSPNDVIFLIKSATTPGAAPGGLDDISTVAIAQGTAETTLGFKAFQEARSSIGAVVKAATLLSGVSGPFAITAGLNDLFKVRVNGIDYQVTLPAGASVATSSLVTAINAVAGLSSFSSVATGINATKLRLLSATNDPSSSITILDGTANAVLGFTQGDTAGQTMVDPQEVVNALNATSSFIAGAVAYVSVLDGQRYLTIESLTTGLTASSIGFAASSNSAFNPSTGINVNVTTDGDSGEDAQQIFTVASNNPAGSVGQGVPGQTYTDVRTGLRFSVLPSQVGAYSNGGSFTLTVNPTFTVEPARPSYAVPGLEVTVTNTVNVPTGDTATLQTFNPGGVEPTVGDLYYVSYSYLKQDFSARVFRQLKTITANYGPISSDNRVSLAAYLALTNGALLVGIKQVLKVTNTSQANDQSFIAALDELRSPLQGNIRPDIVVPLATTTPVYTQLMRHVETCSDIHNQSERIGFIGFASGTAPTAAQTVARGLNSNRIVALYPDSAVITLMDELGQKYEQLTDGTVFAAALAGAVVSSAVDVATPYDRRNLLNITRIPRILDAVEAGQTAVSGITILEDLDTIIRVRHGLTTQMDTLLTRTPSVIQISDFVQQQSRGLLDSFVGSKFLASRTNEVNVAMTGLLRQFIQAEIIAAFNGVSSAIDPDDQTVLRFEAYYQPIFPLLYLILTFNLRARL